MTANDIINKLIMDMIQSYDMSGPLKDGFILDRDILQLRRISDPNAEEILSVAKERKVEMEFDSVKRRFTGTVDLDVVVLNERQAGFLERVKKRKKDEGK